MLGHCSAESKCYKLFLFGLEGLEEANILRSGLDYFIFLER